MHAEGGGRSLVDDVSFRVRRGEIVGIAGVEGNGQSELVEAILGLREVDGGALRLGDDDITEWPTKDSRDGGIGYIPRTATVEASSWRPRSGRTACWDTSAGPLTPEAPGSTGGAPVARRPTSSNEFDVRTPGHRRRRVLVVRAATSRS